MEAKENKGEITGVMLEANPVIASADNLHELKRMAREAIQ
jgi:hypothetical protein